MCGIIGFLGERETDEVLYKGLKRLDYRGYDSWGMATEKGTHKQTGKLNEAAQWLKILEDAKIGIGHTRWATHGGVTDKNAHPHESCDKSKGSWEEEEQDAHVYRKKPRFAIVHNGIIENHDFLRKKYCEAEGHEFTSETDSEVIAHFIEQITEEGLSVREALEQFHKEAEGSYAVVVLDREEEKLYGLKNKSPLVVGIGGEDLFLASDIYAFSKHCNKSVFLEDGDVAELWRTKNGVALFEIYNNGEEIQGGREPKEFEWTEEEPELEENDHWMEKEIREIPDALMRLIEKNCPKPSGEMENLAEKIEDSERVIFTASGTSYHASLLGVYYLQKAGVEAQALIASEFENYERVNEETTLIAVSQSGETRDVLDAIEYSREKGADVVSITNVPYSTIERKSDYNFRIDARQEICVAATKTFTNQLGTMILLARELGAEVQLDGVAMPLARKMMKTRMEAMDDAGKMKNEDDIYVLGSGITYPLAREIALKLKEISYKHAEGMMAGELKHGTLALIEEGTPVIALNEGDLDSSISEVESRGADVVDIDWTLPEENTKKWESEELYLFRAVIYGFWLTYYLGKYNGLPIDKPRNLSKSVTVK